MPLNTQEKVIKVASDAYYEPSVVAPKNMGDTLGLFIYREVSDAVSGESNFEKALEIAAELMWKAVDDLRAVALALENHDGKEEGSQEAQDRASSTGTDVG